MTCKFTYITVWFNRIYSQIYNVVWDLNCICMFYLIGLSWKYGSIGNIYINFCFSFFYSLSLNVLIDLLLMKWLNPDTFINSNLVSSLLCNGYNCIGYILIFFHESIIIICFGLLCGRNNIESPNCFLNSPTDIGTNIYGIDYCPNY